MFINTCAKRGKGRHKVDIGIKDYYDFYCEKEIAKKKEPKDYNLFASILRDANQMIKESIVIHNDPIVLPYKLGILGIIKYKPMFNPDKQNKWKVDYKKSKEAGFIVYYDQENRYRWKWMKDTRFKLKGKRWYTFVPSRDASRSIARALRENKRLDYFEKL